MDVLATSPQITLKSVEGETVFMNASAYWKKMLADFLDYACTTDDIDNTPIPMYEAEMLKDKIVLQIDTEGNELNLLRQDLLILCDVFGVFSHITKNDFYNFSALEFDRLHDDIGSICETVYHAHNFYTPRLKAAGEQHG